MDSILRRTIKSGNASAVVLPKTWLAKTVRIELIEKDNYMILQEVLEIIKSSVELSEIFGVYLVGSYARKDRENSSDIDILVLSEKTDREIIKERGYEILIVSKGLLDYKLKKNLLPIGTMLREAIPLLNGKLIRDLKVKVTKENVKWYIETTRERLKVIRESVDRIEKNKPNGKLNDLVSYSLVLRLRTLYMINCLIKNKAYKKEDFVRLIKNISGSLISYERYTHLKNDGENKRELPLIEGKKLYDYLKNYLEETKRSIK